MRAVKHFLIGFMLSAMIHATTFGLVILVGRNFGGGKHGGYIPMMIVHFIFVAMVTSSAFLLKCRSSLGCFICFYFGHLLAGVPGGLAVTVVAFVAILT